MILFTLGVSRCHSTLSIYLSHRRRKVKNIWGGGGGEGGQGLEYWGAKGGANSQQAHDVVMTSMRRNDVASTSLPRHVPNKILINQCQIIAFLILKASTKFRIERNSFASTFKSN